MSKLRDKLVAYNFTDEHGHPLVNCVDFIRLVDDADRLRAIVDAQRGVIGALESYIVTNALHGEDETFNAAKRVERARAKLAGLEAN